MRLNPSQRGDWLSPTEMARLGSPLDLINEDHYRLRHICAVLDRLSGKPSREPVDLEQTRGFLRMELSAHIADEEEDLFPMLRKRCEPEDQVERTLDRLSKDHSDHLKGAKSCLAILDGLRSRRPELTMDERAVLRGFADKKRRHLILENAILLPLARARLMTTDLRQMLEHMLDRRGLPGGGYHAG